jgi:hypothetical protein
MGVNDDIGPSPGLWADCPLEEINRFGIGYEVYEQFTMFTPKAAGAHAVLGNGFVAFADTGGSIVDALIPGGGLTFSSDGDDEGASLACDQTPFNITQNGGKLWFELAFATSTIANTKHGILAGLMDAQTLTNIVPITAGGAIADINMVGFHRLEADGDKMDTVYKADGITAVTVKADGLTLVADAYMKVGGKYDPSTKLLTYYADGVALPDTKTIPNATGDDFPADVTMGLFFAILNATAITPGNSILRWWRCVQLYV